MYLILYTYIGTQKKARSFYIFFHIPTFKKVHLQNLYNDFLLRKFYF